MKGFSLVELLVATAVMAILATAGVTGLLRGNGMARDTAALQRLQERTVYAMGTLEADIQMAGYFGLAQPGATASITPGAPASGCEAEQLAALATFVEILPQFSSACAPTTARSRPGTAVLVVRRASTRTSTPDAMRWQWFSRSDMPERSVLIGDGVLPPGTTLAPGRTELRNLVVHMYYIATSSDGDPNTPALRVRSLTAIAGRPGFIDTEVMPGVENFHAQLLPDANDPQALRVTLDLQQETSERQATGPTTRLSHSRLFALRNVTAGRPLSW